MSVYAGPNATSSGLVLHIDPSNPRCYPGSGSTLFDLSGGGNNGTLTNGASVVSQRSGRALDFDGVDDWVNLGDVLGFTGSNQTISISWWAYLKNINDAMTPFSKCRNSSTNSGWKVASYASGGVYYVYWFSANALFPFRWFVQAAASGSALQWRHYAVTFHAALGASGTKIYENSKLLTNQVLESGSTSIAANSLTAKISANDSTASPGTPIDFAPAVLDDIRIYNRALTESEIRLLASRPGIGLQPSPTRLIAREKKTGLRRKILTGQT